ncbi:unnamed protein product [Phaeothamnion confervicola]
MKVADDPDATRRSRVGPKCLGIKKTVVPTGASLFMEMWKDNWLHVNDNLLTEVDIAKQVQDELTQLGLINALLLTMCWSSFFDVMGMKEAASWRGDIDDHVEFWIDVQIVLFGMGNMGFGFSTIGSVFYLLAANEASTGQKVHSLQESMGKWVSAPFYFFFAGLAGWGSGFYVQGCVATTYWGSLGVFLGICVTGTVIFIVSISHVISSVFLVQRLSEDNRPVTPSTAEVQESVEAYKKDVGAENINFYEFKLFLVHSVGEFGYWPGVSEVGLKRAETVFQAELEKIAASG